MDDFYLTIKDKIDASFDTLKDNQSIVQRVEFWKIEDKFTKNNDLNIIKNSLKITQNQNRMILKELGYDEKEE